MSSTVANYIAYAAGNCTRWVAQNLPWIPPYLGNGGQWLASAQKQGLATSSTPTVGSVVVYKGGGNYDSVGHVAIVEQVYADGKFLVSEMNYLGLGQVDNRVSNMSGVEGFILPPAGASTALPSDLAGHPTITAKDTSGVVAGSVTPITGSGGAQSSAAATAATDAASVAGSGLFSGIFGGIEGFAVGVLAVILGIVLVVLALWFVFRSFEQPAYYHTGTGRP